MDVISTESEGGVGDIGVTPLHVTIHPVKIQALCHSLLLAQTQVRGVWSTRDQ